MLKGWVGTKELEELRHEKEVRRKAAIDLRLAIKEGICRKCNHPIHGHHEVVIKNNVSINLHCIVENCNCTISRPDINSGSISHP